MTRDDVLMLVCLAVVVAVGQLASTDACLDLA